MIQWILRCQCHIFCPDNVWRPKPVPNKYGIDMTPTSLRQVKRWDVLFCFNVFFNIIMTNSLHFRMSSRRSCWKYKREKNKTRNKFRSLKLRINGCHRSPRNLRAVQTRRCRTLMINNWIFWGMSSEKKETKWRTWPDGNLSCQIRTGSLKKKMTSELRWFWSVELQTCPFSGCWTK